tara:strand:+ start:100 stop:522 length:423 start_codon:yes stop_codon:yes gene_type:complete
MARLSAAEKEKRKPKFLKNLFKGRRAKTAEAASKKATAESAMKKKVYAAESMFKSAKSRDDAKVAPGKARPFKEAFDSATKAGKSKFMHKGKSYLTTKGKRADRFDPTKIKAADKKESTLGKFKSSKTLKEFFGKIKKKK